MKKITLLLTLIYVMLPAAANVQCEIGNERIYCTYSLDRSDNKVGKEVIFHWISPNGDDDRIRHFQIPPQYGSVYDYRFLPGRSAGQWRVVVTDTDDNKSVETTFDINDTDTSMFEED